MVLNRGKVVLVSETARFTGDYYELAAATVVATTASNTVRHVCRLVDF